jgi:hypothetical protein
MINEKYIQSWTQLQEELFSDSFDNDIRRFRSNYVFRGVTKASYDLSSSLIRICDGHEKLENNLLKSFEKYAKHIPHATNNFWDMLSLAQHHGLPTRLLDWTFSPYVALHFATDDNTSFNEDSAIWCVNFSAVHKNLPNAFRKILDDDSTSGFTTDMLADVVTNLKKLDTVTENTLAIFFEPPSLDSRIINQFSIFSIMSDRKAIMSDYLLEHPNTFKKIIIPSKLKWEVRDKLDQANITERVLFPGLDGLCKWLSRYYRPNKD